jgi:Secretion system C-terminal sorting domain
LTSTDELDKTAVSISPNPFDAQLSIQIKSDMAAEGNAEIFDLLGKSVSNTPLSILSGANVISIETRGLSAGAYLLKITVGGKTRSSKIVKL